MAPLTASAPADPLDAAAPLTTVYRPHDRVDVRLTLSVLRRGGGDPRLVLGTDGTAWYATRTPAGPATLHLAPLRDGVAASAWGLGSAHALAAVPDLLGARDDHRGFDPRGHVGLTAAHRRLAGLRVPRTGHLVESLVPAVLEQRVQTIDAQAAWRWLLLRHGEPAPGPAPRGLRVPPDVEGWRRVPVWDWRRAGVDDRRATTVLRALAVVDRLQEAVDLHPAELARRMLTVPGIGPWTVGEVARRACGDTDAVSVGDLHLPRLVGLALVGHPVEDAQAMALLEPWRPHRQRVVRLLELTPGSAGPRHHPRPPRAFRPR
ncbi:MAG TPA: DNA-3-methyladenine glycosylase 2 family protein [Cellulomonas sp.]